MTTRQDGCVVTCWDTTSRASIECSVINAVVRVDADPNPGQDREFGAVCRWTNSPAVELLDEGWRTEPHASQRCVKSVEIDADDYPDGDPQKGQ